MKSIVRNLLWIITVASFNLQAANLPQNSNPANGYANPNDSVQVVVVADSFLDGILNVSGWFGGSAVACDKQLTGDCKTGTSVNSSGSFPLPAAIWLFGTALIGIAALRRHRLAKTSQTSARSAP